jgi:hypothetical protein
MEVDTSSVSGALAKDANGDYIENTGNIIRTTKTFTPNTSYE